MDRRLIVVTLIATLLIVALAISLGVFALKYRDVEARVGGAMCLTSGCIHTASMVLKNMNPQADPCVDFYEFACGGFEKSTTIPDDKTEVNLFSVVNDKLQEKLKLNIEEPSKPDELRTFKLAKNLYNTCLNTSAIEKTGLTTLHNILKELGGWPVLEGNNRRDDIFTWIESIQKCLKIGYADGYLINLTPGIDSRNSTRQVFQFDQAALILPRDYLLEGMENKIVKAYFEYMVDTAVALGANEQRASQELMEALEFETKLANISWSDEVRKNASLLENPMTISEMNKRYPSVNWELHMNTILPPTVRFSGDSIVNVVVPSYISDLENIMKDTPARIWKNYLLWRVVEDSIQYLTKDLRAKQLNFLTVMRGDKERHARWKECLDVVSDALSISVGALYVRNHFNGDAKQKADGIMTDIRNGFVDILKQANWMDEKTRASALEKVASMATHIAYPVEFHDDGKLEEYHANLELEHNQFLANVLNVSIFQTNFYFERLTKPVNKTDWINHGTSAIVNAFYDLSENAIQVPAGILQESFFSNDRPRYMNYGAIGSIMGHEITHGFDNEGSLYDKEGNMVDWWNPETKEKYLKNAECIIQQYGKYTAPSVGLNLDGFNTQGENIADNGGLKQAYLAYKKWVEQHGPELPLPGLKYTPEQMFWVSAANVWCVKIRPEALELDIKTDVHSPGRFRVIGPFSNRPEFSDDFNCPSGSRMNPVKKCSVW